MKVLSYILTTILFSQTTFAASEFSCKTLDVQPDVRTFTQHAPDYFTKSVPIPLADKGTHFKGFMDEDEDFGTYIGNTGDDENNRIIRLRRHDTSGATPISIEYRVPGPYDPVPSPDGRILSVASPMRFYDFREFLIDGHSPEPLHLSETIDGVYQSIAWLRDVPLENALKDLYDGLELKKNQRLYRIVTDNDALIPLQDFLVTYKEDCDVKAAVAEGKHCMDFEMLKPKNEERAGMWAQCGDTALKTLYISRRGNYLAGYSNDENGGTTKIIDISKRGECPQLMDFGHPTGKVDFNDNEDKVTFHIDYLNEQSGNYFSEVDDFGTKDVYVADLQKTGNKLKGVNLRRISTTTERGKGCYYPSFFNDQVDGKERLLCMFDEGNSRDGGDGFSQASDGYDFRILDVAGLQTDTNAFLPTQASPDAITSEEKQRLHNAAVVGLIWGKACNPEDNDEYTAVQAATLFLNIQSEDCEKIADLWGGADVINTDFKTQIAKDRRFEDDPRFGDPSYILENISKESIIRSCEVAKKYQAQVIAKQDGKKTEIFGAPDAGTFEELTGAQIAKRKCTGCHHYAVPLNASLQIDIDAGISSFVNLFQFGGHRQVPLMFIDASLERIGYDPKKDPGSNDPQQVDDILDYLGRIDDTSRVMPPINRVRLPETDEYNERKILGRYLYKMRKERVKEIEASGQQEVQ